MCCRQLDNKPAHSPNRHNTAAFLAHLPWSKGHNASGWGKKRGLHKLNWDVAPCHSNSCSNHVTDLVQQEGVGCQRDLQLGASAIRTALPVQHQDAPADKHNFLTSQHPP